MNKNHGTTRHRRMTMGLAAAALAGLLLAACGTSAGSSAGTSAGAAESTVDSTTGSGVGTAGGAAAGAGEVTLVTHDSFVVDERCSPTSRRSPA